MSATISVLAVKKKGIYNLLVKSTVYKTLVKCEDIEFHEYSDKWINLELENTID